jgi:hypothetical protein
MIVEVRINNDETESVYIYDQAGTHHDSDCDDNVCKDCSVVDTSVVGNFDTSSCRENILKYRMVQERWKKSYSVENSRTLQDAVKKQVFKDYFGDDGTLDNDDFVEDYDPLLF